MRRSVFLSFCFVLCLSLLVLGARLFQLQVIDAPIYQAQADGNRIRRVSVEAPRGIVYDRNSRQLISNEPAFSVAVTGADLPEDATEQQVVFARLAELLATGSVVTAVPDQLYSDPAVAARVIPALAAQLGVPVADLQQTLDGARKTSPAAPNLLRRDLTPAMAAAIAAHSDWPGVQVMNELQYTFITRRESPISPVIVLRNIPYETMQRIEEAHLALPGVSIVPEAVRQYALGSYLGQILGYVGAIPADEYAASLPPEGSGDPAPYNKDDKVGLVGVEASLENVLRGQKGMREIEVNANQREVREISSKPPVAGHNAMLTIDSALQISVTRALAGGIAAAHRTGGTGGGVAIVEKVNTGEILAMVSLPSYDDNLFAAGISQQDFDQLNHDPTDPLFDRAIGGAYPPGSTFKMITAAAGLQEHVITPDTRIFDPGHIDVPLAYNENQRTRFNGWKATGLGSLNVVEALEQSCDVCFYEIAGPAQQDVLGKPTRFYIPGDPQPHLFFGLGIDKLHTYMQAFGLGAPTGVGLPGEAAGVAPTRPWKLATFPGNNWSLGDTLYTGIGQAFTLMTPLQLVNATAAVANGGTLYQPQIVEQVLDSDGGTVLQPYQPHVIRQIPVQGDYLALVRQGMRLAVGDPHKGTAYKTELRGVQIAGKTGTAEIGEPIDAAGHRRAHAWFTAFAPYDHPDIAVTVLLEAGDESLEGSTFAVPVARSIFESYFHLESEK